ncbi:MAG: hypothetical protein JSR54_08665 [Proteobacteria bacterium]|nr:hypothetical protein [Pseudomonadota bacterium]
MDPGIREFIEQARGSWRFRWIALAAAWLFALAGWAIILVLPNSYQATARVFVDTQTALSEVAKGITVEGDVEVQIQRVRQALLGGPQLLRVAQGAGLVPQNVDLRDAQPTMQKLQKAIEITGGGARAGVYLISYKNSNRDVALRVVDQLLRSFVLGSLGGKREGSQQAQQFLTEQIKDYEKRLTDAEERLADFKKKNVALMPGSQGDYFASLRAEMEALDKSRAALEIATKRRDEFARQLRGGAPATGGSLVPAPGVRVGPAVANPADPAQIAGEGDTARRIRETQARLDELLLRFTENHPDVIALRETLEELRKRQQSEIDALRKGDVGAAARVGLDANPVYQSLQLQYNQAGADVAAAQAEVYDHQQRVERLRGLVNTAPGIEAQFARLNRDYDVTRAQYQTLLQRLEQTKLGEEAQETGIVRFEVIEPPGASYEPVSPNRPILIGVVVFMALALGASVAYVLHLWRPVVTSARHLAEFTGLDVIGEVGMVWLEKYRTAQLRGTLLFAGATLSLVGATVALIVFQAHVVHLLHGGVA